MKFLRHKNGNGRIDRTSEACAFSAIDRLTIVEEKSSVWSSSVKNSLVKNSTITSSVIENSTIENSLITGGKIENSSIYDAELVADYAHIVNSTVIGKSRIAHTAYIENCKISNFTVTGNARLIGFVADGREAYIDTGIWTRPPRVMHLDGGLTITESINGAAFVGCRKYEISHWLKVGNRYGKIFNLTGEEINRIREFLKSLCQTQSK